MPKTDIRIYQDADGTVPLLDWLNSLSKRARIKCIEKIGRLQALGHELRRPDCDYLTEGIYELRARAGNVNCRILYAFTGKHIVLLSHGLTKLKKVPKKDIERAVKNLAKYKRNPQKHIFEGEIK